MEHTLKSTNVAEILERVLDKGLVIAGDITISIAEIDLLKIKIRLLVASVDKAKEIGINWWETDPYLSTAAQKQLEEGKQQQLLPATISSTTTRKKSKKTRKEDPPVILD